MLDFLSVWAFLGMVTVTLSVLVELGGLAFIENYEERSKSQGKKSGISVLTVRPLLFSVPFSGPCWPTPS